MDHKYPKPAWWALYAILPLIVGLLFLESRVALSMIAHQLLELAIVGMAAAMFGLWITANTIALEIDADGEEQRVPARPVFKFPPDVVQQLHRATAAHPTKERLN